VHEPKLPQLKVLKSRLSPEVWAKREREAREGEKLMKALAAKFEDEGLSFNEAVRKVMPAEKRSWAVRRWPRWKKHGLDGLFDLRKPPKIRMSKKCKNLVIGARIGNPHLTIDQAFDVLTAGGIKKFPSVSGIKRLMRQADSRRHYYEKKSHDEQEHKGHHENPPEDTAEERPQPALSEKIEKPQPTVPVKTEELEFAGGELLKAAELEVGVIEALTSEVRRIGREKKAVSGTQEKTGNDELRDGGKLTAAYNQARTRPSGQETASYLRPAPERGSTKVAADFSFIEQSLKAVKMKIGGMVYEGLVNPGRGWDGLRSTSGEHLELLVGYAYMPATLSKQASELAQLDAGPRLVKRAGLQWHRVASKRWGEPGEIAALYVDNHVKEVWSSLFTKAGKVSHRSRVMPCITTTYVQTGAGTPVVVQVSSGSNPLSPQLCKLVEETESRLGHDIRRAVVIDSEGSVFDILESFTMQNRVMVTVCRAPQLRELELRFRQGSYYRPYRDHDELRVAQATLHHKSTKRKLDIGALLIRRNGRPSPMILLTTGLKLGFKGRELADLYFKRWPLQENFFKDGATLGLDRHRGNCSKIVTNVAVATELESLDVRLNKAEKDLGQLNGKLPSLLDTLEQSELKHQEAELQLSVCRQKVDDLVSSGEVGSQSFADASVEHHAALVETEKSKPLYTQASEQLKKQQQKREDTIESIDKMSARVSELEPMRKIRQLDVSLDTVLTAMKLSLALLITFVMREYIPSDRMSTETFVCRLLTTRGRREISKHLERITFYENPRDPRVNEALAEACAKLNSRELFRDDRELVFALEERPP